MDLTDGWQEFTGGRTNRLGISITSKGTFGVTDRAAELIGHPERVVFSYNRARRAIGIRAAQDGDPYSQIMRKQANSRAYVIVARAFLQYIDYPVGSPTRTFVPTLEEGMLVIELGPPP